jgi:hypothetical protein
LEIFMKLIKGTVVGSVCSGFLLGSFLQVPPNALGETKATNAEYGYSTAISGPVAVVGAPGEDNGAGAIYIKVRSGTHWGPGKIRIADPAHISHDAFGSSVAVSSSKAGTYLVVGEKSINGAINSVYIYSLTAGKWHKVQTIVDPEGWPPSNFGYSVAITSSTLAIGAPGANNQYGAVYMYARSGSRWTPTSTLIDPGTNYDDNFGFAVAVSGTTTIVTARDVRVPTGGIAYVYSAGLGRPWKRSKILNNPGGGSDDFGASASVSGKTIVIGAPGSGPVFSQGAVYVAMNARGTWQIKTTLASSASRDGFGYAVAITGNRVLVGAPTGGSNKCGIAYEFLETNTGWHRKETIRDPHGDPGDQFGAAVSASGTTGLIGIPGRNEAFGPGPLK